MYFKFNETDVFRNVIVTYPKFECVYKYSNSTFKFLVNNPIRENSMANVSVDGINVHEKNIDRVSNLIYPFIPKTDSDTYISGISSGSFQSSYIFGDILVGTYNVKKTIAKDYITSAAHPMVDSFRNAWKKYRPLNADFDFDNFPIPCSYHILPRELFGSGIKKGSVQAGFSIDDAAGTDRTGYSVAQDLNKDGVLRVTSDSLTVSSLVGQKVGYVLYDEGVILTFSASILVQDGGSVYIPQLTSAPVWYSGSSVKDYNWSIFGDDNACESTRCCFLTFRGIKKINNLTMMCNAPSGKLNISNNPTFIEIDQNLFLTQSSYSTFVENTNLRIQNIVSSSYNTIENFEKETYISEVYIYDEHKQIIGIAKLANPLRKREGDQYTVKISYDI